MTSPKPQIILAGLPGDMMTLIGNAIQAGSDYELAHETDESKLVHALAGDRHKGNRVDEDFIRTYHEKTGISLAPPRFHRGVLERLKEQHAGNLYGINFANADGHGVNFMFAEMGIPFISGVTGASKENESALVRAVEEFGCYAVIDKNMSVPLVVSGEMFRHVAVTFSEALEGFSGYGIDSHQSGKAEGISGTLLKWEPSFRGLGVNFVSKEGDRTAEYGHGDHFLRLMSPDGTVKITFQTEVLGRDTYVQGTVEKALPFLIQKAWGRYSIGNNLPFKAGDPKPKGEVYDMADVLRKKDPMF